jgi:endonuclease/exonuclease/phosphatase (EEP) superfamily protein YafD
MGVSKMKVHFGFLENVMKMPSDTIITAVRVEGKALILTVEGHSVPSVEQVRLVTQLNVSFQDVHCELLRKGDNA